MLSKLNKYLTIRELDDVNIRGLYEGCMLPIPLLCGIVKPNGEVYSPEEKRGLK